MFLCIIYSEIMTIFLHYKQYLLYIPVADTDIGPNSTKTISALYNKNIHIYRSINRCNSINIKKQAQSPICFMLTFTFLCLHFNLLFFFIFQFFIFYFFKESIYKCILYFLVRSHYTIFNFLVS